MPYRITPFVNQSYYHIFNRGINRQPIFSNDRDYQRFLATLNYYQFSGPKSRFSTHQRFRLKDFSNNPKIIEIIAFCLMPNHFHLLLRQLKDNGIVEFISKVLNSYTKYYNAKHRRSGSLLEGEFKAVLIETDEQLIHVSRYIHLNPYVSDLTHDLESFPYSSYQYYLGLDNGNSLIPSTQPILEFFNNPKDYQKFIKDHQDYAKELEKIKHLLIDGQ